MQAELATWHKHRCFEWRSRKRTRNMIDCRWVLKWKAIIGPSGSRQRTIRARLTVRGFKDRDADNLESYAGTSTRWSQRIVASQAVVRGWRIVSADVAKAPCRESPTKSSLASLASLYVRYALSFRLVACPCFALFRGTVILTPCRRCWLAQSRVQV